MTIREQAIRLCEFAANGADDTVLDELVRAAEFVPEAGDLADEAWTACALDPVCSVYDRRDLWAEAACRLREGWRP